MMGSPTRCQKCGNAHLSCVVGSVCGACECDGLLQGMASNATSTTAPANDYQVGGSHYKKVPGEQHWDRQWRLYGRGYFIGNITAYVERYPDKNGVEDLKKAAHYIQKLIELEEAAVAGTGPSPGGVHQPLLGKPVTGELTYNPQVVKDGQFVPHPSHVMVHGIGDTKQCKNCGLYTSAIHILEGCDGRATRQTEYCCDCDYGYPRSDLIAGEIYCPACRVKPENQIKMGRG